MYLDQSSANVRAGSLPIAESTPAIATGRFWTSDLAGGLALLLITLVASLVLFGGGVVIGQDSATQFYPWYSYLGERISAFSVPGWNPFQFAGAPFAADPQSGWMYFPAMVIFTLFSLALAAPLFILFHLALAGIGTYILSRLLGIGVGGALVAAVAYEMTSPIYGRSVCCPAQIEVGAWMPAALVGAEIAFRNRHWAWRMIGWTIGGFALSQALGAWLGQGSYYYLLILSAYIAYRALTQHNQPWKQRFIDVVTTGLPIGLISAGIAAAGILPRFVYVSRSNVAGGEYEGASSWASSIGGVTPGMAWYQMLDATLYNPGGVALMLAMAGIVLARRRYASTFFVALSAIAILLAMPWQTPIHWLMFTLLPKFEELHNHWPERVAIVSYLSLAMLAGMAVDALMRDRVSARRFLLAFGIPVVRSPAHVERERPHSVRDPRCGHRGPRHRRNHDAARFPHRSPVHAVPVGNGDHRRTDCLVHLGAGGRPVRRFPPRRCWRVFRSHRRSGVPRGTDGHRAWPLHRIRSKPEHVR